MNDHDDQRHSFLAMPINEQMGILYDMLRYVRSEISTLKKGQVEFEEEMRDVRRKREARDAEIDRCFDPYIVELLKKALR